MLPKIYQKMGFERIAKMHNLLLNELEQITEMNNLSKNKLEEIAKNRRIKNYRNMSKEDLLIPLLKALQTFERVKVIMWKYGRLKNFLRNLEIIFQKKK